jgi:hypothetical protein
VPGTYLGRLAKQCPSSATTVKKYFVQHNMLCGSADMRRCRGDTGTTARRRLHGRPHAHDRGQIRLRKLSPIVSVVVFCSFNPNNPDILFHFAMGLRSTILAAR